MIKLDYVTNRDEQYSLSDNEYFDLINVDAQTSISTNISSSVIGGIDGDVINNIQAKPRTIILDLQIKSGIQVETAKRDVLRYFKIKQKGKLLWYQDDRIVSIEGYVESIDMPRWNNSTMIQITIYCNQPFWTNIEENEIEINEISSEHYFSEDAYDMLFFPDEGISFGYYDNQRFKDFVNDGDVDVGMVITIIALDTVTNPIIYGPDNTYFGVGYHDDYNNHDITMLKGDKIEICTEKGKKNVFLNGVSVINAVKPLSTWLQIQSGDNRFSIDSDEDSTDNMYYTLTYKQRYI